MGDPQPALLIAEHALKKIAADPAPQYLELREQRAAGLAGKAHLKPGNVASALPQLGRAVALAQMHLDAERSPRLADALLALADASLQAGQDDAARAALARAQHILASHAAPVPTLFDTISSPLPVTT